MAIDKIVIQYEAQVAEFKKELDGIKAQLKSVETTAASGAKKTEKSLNDVGKGANDLKETLKGLGQQIAAAFAAREIIRFTKQTIDAASDLNETLSKSQQIFGDASKAVEEFASNSAKQFGMSKQTAIDAAASFGVFGKSAGLTGEDLSTFSTDLVSLSADLASFGNTTPEEAALALGAALRGEAEPIRRFGVLLDDATLKQEALSMGIIKTTKEALTPQEKVLAANAVILKQTSDAQGDFARTSEGAANQQRILEATFKDLQTEIGQKLLPTFNSALSTLNNFLGDLDADDVMSFAKAIGVAATAFGAFKVGNLIKDMGGLTGILKATTGGVQGLSKAVMANPFGLIATAVATLIAYGPDLLEMFNGVNETQKELDEIAYKATENLRKEQAELNLVGEALAKTNPGSEERARLLERFNELSPQGIADLKDTYDLNTQLATAMERANAQYDNRIKKIGLEAAATAASQKQIELKAKITAEEDKLVRETGMSYDEVRKSVKEYIEYQKTGAFPALARAKNLLRGGVGDLAQLQFAYEETTQQTQRIKAETESFNSSMSKNNVEVKQGGKSIKELSQDMGGLGKETKTASGSLLTYGQTAQTAADATKASTDATAANTDKTKDDTKAKEIAKTAIEKLNEELGKLKTAQENATFAGDIQKAGEYQKAISKLENQLSIFKGKLEEVRGGIVDDSDLEALDKANDSLLSAGVDALIDAELSKAKKDRESLGTFTDEEGIELPVIITIQEKAKQDALKKVGEIETKMGEVFGAVNSVLGPAMDALNGYFDLQLNNLDKEKNERLSNEKLTAEERLRIEEEYEAKKNAILAEQFEVSRGSQIIQAIMSSAQAALNAFTSTALLFAPAAPAAAAAAAAFGALQIGIIAAQPNPYKFFEGTDYLQLGGNPRGKDTIPVMAHEGEAIIPTGKNLQYPGLAKSWIDGNLDSYIHKKFISPALMEQQREMEADFADKIAASMALQMTGGFDDYRLFRAIKEQTAIQRVGFENLKQTRKKLRGA
jgi:hypothetical protein